VAKEAVESEAEPFSAGDSISQQSIKKVRVLVADDYESMQLAIVSCLGMLDELEVVGTASNGEDALAKSSSLNPDLVIADLQMPVMDGFRLLRALRKAYPSIRLIAISGHFSPMIEKEALSAGANLFVSKVGLPGDLLAAVKQLLAQQLLP
jgi:DNA-binding NarL/FixJ family response regulator